MANVLSPCGDQSYWNTTSNLPSSTITVDNTSGTITVSGISVNQPQIGGALTGTSITAGSTLTIANGTSIWTSNAINNDMTEFCEMVLSALGHDTSYDDFCKMSSSERKALLRDIKIKRVLD